MKPQDPFVEAGSLMCKARILKKHVKASLDASLSRNGTTLFVVHMGSSRRRHAKHDTSETCATKSYRLFWYCSLSFSHYFLLPETAHHLIKAAWPCIFGGMFLSEEDRHHLSSDKSSDSPSPWRENDHARVMMIVRYGETPILLFLMIIFADTWNLICQVFATAAESYC